MSETRRLHPVKQATLMPRRTFLRYLTVGSASALLVACGQPAAPPASKPAEAPKPTEAAKPAAPAATTAPAAAAKPTEAPAAKPTTAPAAAAKPAESKPAETKPAATNDPPPKRGGTLTFAFDQVDGSWDRFKTPNGPAIM